MIEYRTKIVRVDPEHPDPGAMREAAELLRSGEVVAMPTDTIYGVGVDAFNEAAVQRLFEAKKRPPDRPLAILVAEPDDVEKLVSKVTDEARALIERFWPGPLTIVLPRAEAVPSIVTAGQPTLGVRCPDSVVARALIREARTPLAVTSANISGREAPTDAAGVFEQLLGRIPLIIDAGASPIGTASTVIDLSVKPAKIVREGAVSREEMSRLIEIR